MKEPRSFKELIGATDWLSVGLIVVLYLVGLITIWSAVGGSAGRGWHFLSRQLAWGGISLAVGLCVWKIDLNWLLHYSYVFYALGLITLILLLIVGHTAKGAQSWFNFGGFRLQPSELMKILLALVMAQHLVIFEPRGFKNFCFALSVGGLAAFLVLIQPDLGSTLVYAAMIFVALYVGGAPGKYLAGMVGVGVCALPPFWFLLKDYQKNRLLVFWDPSRDPMGAGYNVIQSRIAVGSGGLLGKGFMAGTQSKLRFLPEPHTDFVFSVFAEEFGFIASLLLLSAFAWLLWRLIGMALRQQDRRLKVFVGAVTVWLWFQFFESMAMAMGLMPVTGLPMPLISYGGSSLLATVIALSICIKCGALAELASREQDVAIDRLPPQG